MNDDNLIRQAWLAMKARLEAQTGISHTEAEDRIMFMCYGLGALAWNRMLSTAGENEEARLVLKQALAEMSLEMSAGEPVGRVM